MRDERVEFFSEGVKLRGFLRLPDASDGPLPGIVHGPGWLGLASAKTYEPWHQGLTAAGYAVLAFDYRGFGDSDGERGWIKPDWQLQDILNAITYLESRPEVDARRLGTYGIGGTGGGNAIVAAAIDERIRCVAAQSVVADGRDWLHRMRREYEWVDYLRRVEADRRRWVLEGSGDKVNPREDLMVETPERRDVGPKKDVDARMPTEFYLRSADHIMRYRPIDYVARLAPRAALLMTSVQDDVVTPHDHAFALYERAGAPKKLIHQTDTTHYRSYTQNYPALMPIIVDWYDRYLKVGPLESREAKPAEEILFLQRPGE
ncbi:MAG TPA: alpha/beta fold hydrolase [Chloroflexota bacterium]|jgi:cephalosporin-C deacetylase-like acetyl esterase|nr:alpha/beta fold hydrolase [Chloroflexota bacterium]